VHCWGRWEQVRRQCVCDVAQMPKISNGSKAVLIRVCYRYIHLCTYWVRLHFFRHYDIYVQCCFSPTFVADIDHKFEVGEYHSFVMHLY
jgi:hypothetical protein